jgi:hypothetical protein
MDSVQSSIRAEVSHRASPVPKGAETFAAYAIASAKGLIPEMEYVARLTLDHPMTFEFIGESLRLFEGWALRDLVNFRKSCKFRLMTSLDSYSRLHPFAPSTIWVGCPEVMPSRAGRRQYRVQVVPKWLNELLSRNQNDLKVQVFTHPLDILSRIRQEYSMALRNHTCNFCSGVHTRDGLTFYADFEKTLVRARNNISFSFQVPPRDLLLVGTQ